MNFGFCLESQGVCVFTSGPTIFSLNKHHSKVNSDTENHSAKLHLRLYDAFILGLIWYKDRLWNEWWWHQKNSRRDAACHNWAELEMLCLLGEPAWINSWMVRQTKSKKPKARNDQSTICEPSLKPNIQILVILRIKERFIGSEHFCLSPWRMSIFNPLLELF